MINAVSMQHTETGTHSHPGLKAHNENLTDQNSSSLKSSVDFTMLDYTNCLSLNLVKTDAIDKINARPSGLHFSMRVGRYTVY